MILLSRASLCCARCWYVKRNDIVVLFFVVFASVLYAYGLHIKKNLEYYTDRPVLIAMFGLNVVGAVHFE